LGSKTRPPSVAGQFYPSDKDELFELIHRSFTDPIGPGKFPSKSVRERKISKVESYLVPHAGYIYSGPVAAHSYDLVHDFLQSFIHEKKIVVIILGPNHYGIGSGVALSSSEFWETPIGKVRVDVELAKRLTDRSSIIDLDDVAHSREHSIEVQIPFLQAVGGSSMEKVSILPICMMLQDFETAREVGNELYNVINEEDIPFVILGSSDLTHYEQYERAFAKDSKLLKEVEKMDIPAFYTIIERLNLSACGYGAIAATMQISQKLGKKKGEILKYSTSGDTSGDKTSVVGYPSVLFS
jgi:AmmeMemoRadiSam system protein B